MPLTCTAADARFLSTPSGWRATLVYFRIKTFLFSISIHALRVEGDRRHSKQIKQIQISIHALRVEGDLSFILPVP